MAIPQLQEQSPFSLLDVLYCEEQQWEEEGDEICERNPSLLPLLLLEQDLFWDDEELLSLFCKEKQGSLKQGTFDISLSSARKNAVEWMLKVNAHYGFCTLTSILTVNYFDRFLSSFHLQNDKPWMFQLAAVTCLSLAAKVEETHVPLLLDLQVEGAKYVFEAKTIQKMELLVLSTLEWKMNPVTPLSFLDHIIRRLGLKNQLHWEFLLRCEGLLLSFLSDWRLVSYLPSVMATATMMHVIDQIEPCKPLEYHNQLLGVLNISKERVKDCYKLMVEISSTGSNKLENNAAANPLNNSKRKLDQVTTNNIIIPANYYYPSSPSGVIDAHYHYYNYYLSSDDNSNSSSLSSSPSTTTTSSPVSRKKGRVHEHENEQAISRVFIDAIDSPR